MSARRNSLFLAVPMAAACGWAYFGHVEPSMQDFRPNGNRALVVALEGADDSFLRRMLESGSLPELRSRQDRVSRCETRSGAWPVLANPAREWTELSTGLPSRWNGISTLSALGLDGYDEVPVSTSLRVVPAFWEVLSHYGLRVAVVGWWTTWPADAVHGALVSDRFFLDRFGLGPFAPVGYPLLGKVPISYRTGASALTWPDELADSLSSELARVAADPVIGRLQELSERASAKHRRPLERLRGALEHDQKVLDATERLLEAGEVDCATCSLCSLFVARAYFSSPMGATPSETGPGTGDRAEAADAVLERTVVETVLEFLDRRIARLYRRVGEDAFLVLTSPQGFGSDPEPDLRQASLDRLLEALGFQVRSDDGEIDFERTRCFDRALQPYGPRRVLDLNFTGDFPRGIVAAEGWAERARAWNEVVRALSACRVDPPWTPPDHGAASSSLFVQRPERIVPGSSWSFVVSPWLSRGTRILLPDGEVRNADDLFPWAELSARPGSRGLMWVVQPQSVPGRGLSTLPPLDVDSVASTYSLAPTLLALFGLPRMEAQAPARYELLPKVVAERSSLAVVETQEYLAEFGRQGPRTARGPQLGQEPEPSSASLPSSSSEFSASGSR